MRIAFFCLLCLMFLSGCFEKKYQGPLSNHYNGVIFYNKNIPKKYGKHILQEVWNENRKPHIYDRRQIGHVTPTNSVKVTFVNHATVLIQTKNVNLITDPVWSFRLSPFLLGPARVRAPGIKFEDLPRIDIVLISHNHYDHLDMPTIIRLERKFHPIFIVPLGDKAYLQNNGIKNIVELDWWNKCKYKNAVITFLPAQHWSARWFHDINWSLWGSYGIEIQNKKIFFGGDSGYSSYFKQIYLTWGKPDMAFLPIGDCEPRWLTYYDHLDANQAIKAHIDLHTKCTIPMHYGCFPLGSENIDQSKRKLEKLLQCNTKINKQFYILDQGESLEV